jgi:hypothetical protein
MLPLLEAILRASPKVKTFQVLDNDPIDAANFLFKIRCELISGQTLQVRLRAIGGNLRYSYQEITDKPLRRWDNAPHFPDLPNFPHHYHDPSGDVIASALKGEPTSDLPQVLSAF